MNAEMSVIGKTLARVMSIHLETASRGRSPARFCVRSISRQLPTRSCRVAEFKAAKPRRHAKGAQVARES